jgi:hypothetical protein
MGQYTARIPPQGESDLIPFVLQELKNISQSMSDPNQIMLLETSHKAPTKLRDGMIVLADGTNWNPGSGAGFYGYRAGAWRFLG